MVITADEIEALLRPLCRRERVMVCGITVSGKPSQPYIRILMDYEESNITIDECVRLTREIQDILDTGPRSLPNYRLEVSSPGIDFPLRELWQFRKNVGRWLSPPGGSKEKGTVKLLEVTEDGELVLSGENGVKRVHYREWEGAKVVLSALLSDKPNRKGSSHR